MQTKRTKFLIYPKFQLILIAMNTLLMAFISGLVALQVRRSLNGIKQMGFEAQISPDHPFFKFLDWQMSQIASSLAVAFVASCLISFAVTLMLSHRLAGPVVRLRNFFGNIARNGWNGEKVNFRKKDFFSDLPLEVNNALDRIQKDSSEKKAA